MTSIVRLAMLLRIRPKEDEHSGGAFKSLGYRHRSEEPGRLRIVAVNDRHQAEVSLRPTAQNQPSSVRSPTSGLTQDGSLIVSFATPSQIYQAIGAELTFGKWLLGLRSTPLLTF